MFLRHLTSAILEALADTPVVLLHGARQTGKSTLARRLAEVEYPAQYLTLDDAAVLSGAKTSPGSFLHSFIGPLVLDEVQRAPELFLAIKSIVDLDDRPGRFLLTGSADILLLPQLSDSLAGRMEIFTLWPLSQGELAKTPENFIDAIFADAHPAYVKDGVNRADLISKLLAGGYPAIQKRDTEARRRAWFGAYITTILQRDVRDLANIESLTSMPRLLSLLATRAGTLVNAAALSRDLDMPLTTLKRYMTLLETTFLVQVLPAWSANWGKRLVKSPKLLLNDTGLMAYLLGMDEKRLVLDMTWTGPLLENFVIMELRKQAGWSRLRPQLFHFRLQTGQEVDLVLEDAAGNLVGIEVKASTSVSSNDFKGLRFLAETVGRRFRRGVVLYTGDEAVSFGANLHAMPVDALWRVAPAPPGRARRRV